MLGLFLSLFVKAKRTWLCQQCGGVLGTLVPSLHPACCVALRWVLLQHSATVLEVTVPAHCWDLPFCRDCCPVSHYCRCGQQDYGEKKLHSPWVGSGSLPGACRTLMRAHCGSPAPHPAAVWCCSEPRSRRHISLVVLELEIQTSFSKCLHLEKLPGRSCSRELRSVLSASALQGRQLRTHRYTILILMLPTASL